MIKGKWALITGASSGIGEELAREYAKRGVNVVLVARRLDRLNILADELSKSYQVRTHVIAQDLGEVDAAKKIFAQTEEEHIVIDILVNNAGYGFGEHFINASWQQIAQFINVMVTSLIELTYLYLPAMIERKFGRILFVSSIVTFMPGSANMTLYNAAKSFLNKFSQGLWSELAGTGVHATAVCPGLTRTEFQKVAGYEKSLQKSTPSFLWMEANAVARVSIAASEKNKILMATGWVNKCLHILLKLIPNTVIRFLSEQSTRNDNNSSAP